MKHMAYILTLAVLMTGLQSCEKVKGLFDVDFETTLSGDLDVNVPAAAMKSTSGTSFSASVTVDPLSDDEIEKYADKIRNFDINTVVAEVISVDKGSVVIQSGSSFTISNASQSATWTLGDDWTITAGTTLTLEDLAGIYDAVGEILETKEVFTISTQGECSDSDVQITIRVDIDTVVTGNPLE
ncbi:MAG: hypothetical protein R2751_10820 [Bacteroidales bacterium]